MASRGFNQVPPLSNRELFRRDRHICAYCGRPMASREATVDHVIPQWKCRQMHVPPSTWSNTVASCRDCQQRKGGRSMHEAGMRFHNPTFEPKTPRVNYLVLSLSPLPEWRKYIRWQIASIGFASRSSLRSYRLSCSVS